MNPEFWFHRWDTNRIGFHRDQTNSKLIKWWSSLGLNESDHIIVPLCGKSLDLHWLAENHSTTGVELSTLAVDTLWSEAEHTPTRDTIEPYERSRKGQLTVLCGDFFALTGSHTGPVHGFYDRASFIALPPQLRPLYVKSLHRVLEPGASGLMLTIEYDAPEASGPPFSISPAMASEQLGPEFEVSLLETTVIEARGGLADRGVSELNEHVLRVKYMGLRN